MTSPYFTVIYVNFIHLNGPGLTLKFGLNNNTVDLLQRTPPSPALTGRSRAVIDVLLIIF